MMTASCTPPHRRARRWQALALLPAVVLAAGCDRDALPELPEPVAVEVPAPPGAAEPSVAPWMDGLVVSWIEPDTAAAATPSDGNGAANGDPGPRPTRAGGRPRAHALRFAAWDGEQWSEPRTIARGAGWFVNWADFPSLLALDERTLIAHWLQRSGTSSYAYDVMLTRSLDGGATWSDPVRPHRDGTQSEHGFVSLVPAGTGAGIVWLDGRRFAGPDATKEMTVRYTTLDATGALGEEMLLDERACDCCQTAAALTADGPVIAYRDRSPDEIRDIAVTRLVDGRWTPPRPLHEDGWRIDACPVNGPQADAAGRDVVVAWYTAANDSPRVQVTFSRDAGSTFGPPVRIDDGTALGRVDVVLLEGDRALVVWLERNGEEAEVRARLVGPAGRGPARVIAATGAQRASGFPRVARNGARVLFAWTEPDEAGSRVRAAALELPR